MLKVYFLVRRMRIVRMPRNALCRRALRLCAAVRIMRMAHGFASVADNAQAGNPVAEPAFAEFAGFAWVILRKGAFLPIFQCGRRERGAPIASAGKPRFAGFAICTRCAGLPTARQEWYAFCAYRRRKQRQSIARTRSSRVRNTRRQRMGVEFTPLEPKNGYPYSSQYWRGFRPISGPKIGKSATVRFGRRNGPAVRADPWVVCGQAMR